MAEIPKEQRMNLAIEAFNKGQFQSGTACAKAFDVPPRTLLHRLNGMTPRHEMTADCRKLSELEEGTLSRWILDMYERGLPLQVSNVRYLAQLLLSARLKSPEKATIGELWRTPANLYRLNQQKKQIQDLQKESLSSVVAEQVLEKFMKSTELVMQDAVLLKQELHQVRTSNKHQKEKKMMTRAFIQDGGSLTGEEGLQRLREREARGAIAKITGGQHGAVTAIKKAMID